MLLCGGNRRVHLDSTGSATSLCTSSRPHRFHQSESLHLELPLLTFTSYFLLRVRNDSLEM